MSLEQTLIRIAYQNPHMREDLLPIILEPQTRVASDKLRAWMIAMEQLESPITRILAGYLRSLRIPGKVSREGMGTATTGLTTSPRKGLILGPNRAQADIDVWVAFVRGAPQASIEMDSADLAILQIAEKELFGPVGHVIWKNRGDFSSVILRTELKGSTPEEMKASLARWLRETWIPFKESSLRFVQRFRVA